MNWRITVMVHMEPLNLLELLFYNKVFAIGTDFAGCFLSPRGYAWIDMSKRTADKSNLQTVDHCLLTCLKSPGMQANIFRGVPEASASYCSCRGPGCAQPRHSVILTAPWPTNSFRNSHSTNRHSESVCFVWSLGWDLLLQAASPSAKRAGKSWSSCSERPSVTTQPCWAHDSSHSAVKQS